MSATSLLTSFLSDIAGSPQRDTQNPASELRTEIHVRCHAGALSRHTGCAHQAPKGVAERMYTKASKPDIPDTVRRTGYWSVPGKRRVPAWITAVAFAGPFLVFWSAGLRINCSLSLPLGLYKEATDGRALLIEFCPEEPSARLAAIRGYRSNGNCPDGAGPLMKPVVASAGDVVEVSDRGIAVNGSLLPNTAPKTKDSHGRPMEPWPYGESRVTPGFVWVASSYNPWSFDSRYFGPLPVGIIRRHLKPFLPL